jgi:hypothetical protein
MGNLLSSTYVSAAESLTSPEDSVYGSYGGARPRQPLWDQPTLPSPVQSQQSSLLQQQQLHSQHQPVVGGPNLQPTVSTTSQNQPPMSSLQKPVAGLLSQNQQQTGSQQAQKQQLLLSQNQQPTASGPSQKQQQPPAGLLSQKQPLPTSLVSYSRETTLPSLFSIDHQVRDSQKLVLNKGSGSAWIPLCIRVHDFPSSLCFK